MRMVESKVEESRIIVIYYNLSFVYLSCFIIISFSIVSICHDCTSDCLDGETCDNATIASIGESTS